MANKIENMNMDELNQLEAEITSRKEIILKELTSLVIAKARIGSEVTFTYLKELTKATIVGMTANGITVSNPTMKKQKRLDWGEFTLVE